MLMFILFAVIINRGDSFRRRRSRSNSLAPVNPVNLYQKAKEQNHSSNHVQVENYVVWMLGSVGVGKAALLEQFKTSDCINAYDGPGEIVLNFNLYVYNNF